MNNDLQAYARRRDALLSTLTATLSTDERFIAGWLTGSVGRGEQDELSDLDLTLVVAEPYASTLCSRPWQVAGKTTAERLALFSTFGEPAVIHENNNNAPEGGTFTCVIYKQLVGVVDWILRPAATAERPPDSRLLWDRMGIPLVAPPPAAPVEQRASEAAELVAFFWMMAFVTAKYIGRGRHVFVNSWLQQLAYLGDEVEQRLKGETWHYRSGSHITLQPIRESQLALLRQLCERIQTLMPGVVALGGSVPPRPMETLEQLLSIVATTAKDDR
jgi:hypothetical protein